MSPDWIPFVFVPVDKPPGPTSFNVVAKVRHQLPRKTKVGHAGTLDPFASGVLLVGVGKATRFMDDVHQLSKTYMAEIKLGVSTDTLDNTGEIDQQAAVPDLSAMDWAAVCQPFLGKQLQMPPAFSAKKVDGQRAYDLARRGEAVALKPAEVWIHEMTLVPIAADVLRCEVTCSTGTYIRSLGRDVAAALGTVGHLQALRRTRIGGVDTHCCVALEAVTDVSIEHHSLSVSSVLPNIETHDLPALAAEYFVNGRPIRSEKQWPADFLGVCRDEASQITSIYRCQFDLTSGMIQPKAQCYVAPK